MNKKTIEFGNAVVKISYIEAVIFEHDLIIMILNSGEKISMTRQPGQQMEELRAEYIKLMIESEQA